MMAQTATDKGGGMIRTVEAVEAARVRRVAFSLLSLAGVAFV